MIKASTGRRKIANKNILHSVAAKKINVELVSVRKEREWTANYHPFLVFLKIFGTLTNIFHGYLTKISWNGKLKVDKKSFKCRLS